MKLVFVHVDEGSEQEVIEKLTSARRQGNLVYAVSGRPRSYMHGKFHRWYNGSVAFGGRMANTCCEKILDIPLNEEQLAVIEQLRHLEGVGVCIYDVKGGFYDGPEEGWQAFLQTWDKDHMFRSRKPAGKYLYGCDLWLRDSAAGQAVSSLCQTREIGSHLVRVLFAGVSEEETLQRTAEYLKMNSDKVVII